MFSIEESQRTEANIFAGLWGGIVATSTCEEMLIDHTIIEYTGGDVIEGAPAANAGIYEAGDDAYPQITTNNVNGKYVITNSILRNGVSDAIYMMGGQAIIANNLFVANGETGEEAVNVKSGCRVDVAGNVMFAPNTNALKLSSSDQSDVRYQAEICAYNNTIIGAGWRREDETSPMLLQKSCHDMDIIRYLVGRPCTAVSSTGSLLWFRPDNAPEGAAMRCLDGCAARDRCPFDCEKIYMSDKRSGILANPHPTWPTEVICDSYSPQAVTDALRSGPYGRCVYHCDNTVVDHQCVMLSFEGGVEATFTMTAFSRENHRTIRIFGTEGEIQGDMLDGRILLRRFDNDDEVINVSDNGSGHGGGDGQLMLDFISQETTSGLEVSLESHLMCFAAEESRLDGGRRVSLR